MKVEIDLPIPDGYEFVRYGKMNQGETGILQGISYLYRQNSYGSYKNDFLS